MTSDLQADLDAIADEIDRRCGLIAERLVDTDDPWLVGVVRGIEDQGDRLRHLCDDRGIECPPLTSEIITWLEADPDTFVDAWTSWDGQWKDTLSVGVWRARLREHGDQYQYGYRLSTREPATERVRLDQVIGRTLPAKVAPIRRVTRDTTGDHWRAWVFDPPIGLPFDLDVAPDGTVEVLKANP